MTKYIAFDIEISRTVPDGETDWKAYRPLGISCYALAWKDGKEIQAFANHGVDANFVAPQMSREECIGLVKLLQDFVRKGFTLLTWNGLSFDLDIVAEESGMHAECCELAKSHVDPMFQVLCIKGFPVGLDAVSKGLGLSGKTAGMDGALAPQLWAAGEYAKVLEYVRQDARATLSVAMEIESLGGLYWIAKSGRRNWLQVPRLLTVKEAMRLPEPNNSWMTEPLPRSKFVAWMEGVK